MWLIPLVLFLGINGLQGLDLYENFGTSVHRLLSNPYKSKFDSSGVNDEAITQQIAQLFQDDINYPNVHRNRTARSISEYYFQILKFTANFRKRVSEPCYNAFSSSITSIAGIFKGKFPSSIVYMLDSSGKTTSGSIRGSAMRKGSYHQCLQVKDEQNGFDGNYCQVTAEYGPENTSHTLDYAEYQIYPTASRDLFEVAICIPSVCSEKDVNEMVKEVAATRYTGYFEIMNVRCRQSSREALSGLSIFTIIVCSTLTFVLLLGTAYDSWLSFRPKNNASQQNGPVLQQSGRLGQMLLCFSISKNMGFIMNHQENGGETVIPSVNGVRSLTLFWVILTNIFLVAKDRPWVNYTGFLEDLRKWPLQLIFNGRFAADTSFCIGGFLAAYLTLQRLHAKKQFSILHYYLHRYLRLIPCYAMVMLLTSGIYYYSTDGPDWLDTNVYETQCNKHWWKGLAFLNNFSRESKACPSISWYLATHMQLHFIAPFIIYPLHKVPRLGLGLLASIFTIFSAIPSLITATEKLPYFTGRLFYFEPGHDDYIFQIIMKPWTHAAPFLVGIFYGYLLHTNGMKVSINLKMSVLCWLTAITTLLVIMFGFYPYIDGTSKMSAIMGTVYTTITPSLWATSIGWIMFACAIGNGGVINYVLSWGVYDVFGRLSYCAYLLNPLIIFHFMHSRADSFYYDKCIMMTLFIGTIFITTISSIILSVTVERPFHRLMKVLRSKDGNHNVNASAADANDDFTINVHTRSRGSKLKQNLRNYKNLMDTKICNPRFNIFTKARKWLTLEKQSDDIQPLISNEYTE